jgi:flagellar biosynthetic protein FliR
MYEVIDQIAIRVPLYMLVFARMTALLVALPVFGYATFNTQVRTAFSFLLTLIITPLLSAHFSVQYNSMLPLFIDMAREVLVGLMIGFGARLVFEGISLAGAYVGLQMGMAIMNVFDPGSEEQTPIISNFWILLLVTFFVVSDAHHYLLEIIFRNFFLIKPASAHLTSAAGMSWLTGGRVIFDFGLRFGAPILIFLLTIDVGLAFMSRVMPQLNIFFIAMPLKIGAGLIVLIISLDIFQSLFAVITDEMNRFVIEIMKGVA